MSAEPAVPTPEPAEPPIDRRASGVLHHQRLFAVEQLAEKTARYLAVHTAKIGAIDERVGGLANAHEATLIAVRASTDASGRLSTTLDRFGARLEELLTEYSNHLVDDEKQKRSWPVVAIWLWGSSLTAGASLLLWIWSNRETISHWLN